MKVDTSRAKELFQDGYNCSQAVFTAFSSHLDLDEDVALSISGGFGGGMGRLQEKCGAVTGAFMVISRYYWQTLEDPTERKLKTYQAIQEFNQKFIGIHGTTICRELIPVDLKTEEGQLAMKEKNISTDVCQKCVLTSMALLEELL